MIKTKYKPLQIIVLCFGCGLFLFIAFINFSDFTHDRSHPRQFWLSPFIFALAVYLLVLFFRRSPRITFDDDFITAGSFWGAQTYAWDSVSKVLLSTKEVFSVFYVLGQPLEASTLSFEDGRKLILWEDIYSNLADIRRLIVEKVPGKIQDPRPKINSSSPQFLDRKEYKGNPFTSLNTWMVGVVLIIFFVAMGSKLKFDNLLLVPILMLLVCFAFFGIDMNYFIVDNGKLYIKNHYFRWRNIAFDLKDIQELAIETPNKRSTGLRVMTGDFQSRLFGAGSLSEKKWIELVKDMKMIGIPVRLDTYIGRVD